MTSPLQSLYGIAQARGTVNVAATLAQPAIDDNAPALSLAEKQATLLEMLQARSGVYHNAAYEPASDLVQIDGESAMSLINMDTLSIEKDSVPDRGSSDVLKRESG
jgi:hypothetical protein